MFAFLKKNPAKANTIIICLAILSAAVIFRPGLYEFFRLPLLVTSSLVKETKAVLAYRFILDENIKLKKEAEGLRKNIIFLRDLESENRRLKQLLSLKDESPYPVVAARVIARDPGNISSGIIIDKGKKHGIKAKDTVITGSGLAGRVCSVTSESAKVLLINDPESSVASVITRTAQEGLSCGTLTGSIVMRYLEKDSDVQINDAVASSGTGGNFPPGLFIGTIEAIDYEYGGLSKSCRLKPAVNFNQIEEVLVIIE